MKILVIGTLYEPDLGPSAPLFSMLCKELVKLGHQVTVISAVPHYPTGRVTEKFRGKWLWRTVEEGVKVLRVGLPSVKRENLVQRFFQYLCFQFGATLAGLNLEYDVVLAANPFLTVWLPFFILGTMRRKPILYSVNDVYPDVGIALGIFRGKLVINIVAALEGYCLRHASIVHIISDSFRPRLHALGVPDEKMFLVYIWVNCELIRPESHNNAFAQEHHLEDKFVVLYAGNLGLSQGLGHILAAAEQMSNHEKLHFVFVGDGVNRDALIKETTKRHLNNIQFIPFQPRERLSEVLATADVSLVTLRSGLGMDSLPSKIFSILASGRPILLSVDEECESWRLIEQARAGLCIPPESPSKLVQTIHTFLENRDLCKRLGRNGRLWAEQYHSPQSAARSFESMLRKAIISQHGEKWSELQ
jgi:colanic acid biosynthesis glycosyl transferase WcaI